jgi:hypothetical protein
MDRLQIEVSYEWQPVYLREKVEYQFPLAISPYMRTHYKVPAVFRWEIYQKVTGDKKIVYIGEAQELCPKRLYGYLNPGSTQLANKKVNADFRGYINDKLTVKLDICRLQSISFAGSVLGPDAIQDKYVRRLIVEAAILEHKKRGYTVIDL